MSEFGRMLSASTGDPTEWSSRSSVGQPTALFYRWPSKRRRRSGYIVYRLHYTASPKFQTPRQSIPIIKDMMTVGVSIKQLASPHYRNAEVTFKLKIHAALMLHGCLSVSCAAR
ncbi:hypothetical protein MPSEU_000262400 [Mayamaea pseudoterrestris]|nr:hypothetical protein MPSEU_000262400 [Mayamaea pseudoterrestris]